REHHCLGTPADRGLLDETRTTLADIDAAEQRLDDGLYGTCTICGLKIAGERLDALPATPICVGCAG
ncbi:TraR/DksA family transcriptional regulator, partial [Ilumatobacter sp.]|uniref:TraR/DksA family transcriptional regulator n=1 Tax=Ilumatobacter sp. TaxID=1967498 RepID=UPI003C48EB2B